MKRPSIAILASGEGTTAEAFIRLSAEGSIEPEIRLVISNKKTAGVFARIHRLNQELGLNIETLYIGKGNHPASTGEIIERGAQTKAEEAAIIEAIERAEVDLVVLMGYMKKIGPALVRRFGWHSDYSSPYQAMMLNTHPGLLPDSKGLFGVHVQEYVLSHHLTKAGQTLHVVSEGYDEGPKIAEHTISVEPDESPDDLFDRVKAIEKQFLPRDTERFIKERQKYLGVV